MVIDLYTLSTITSTAIIISEIACVLYVVVAGSLVSKEQEKKNLDLMFTIEKYKENGK